MSTNGTLNGNGQTPAEVINLPRINEPAPDFEINSTQGIIKLSNYRGKYVVLFSHPSDFTPVCTTEFVPFAKHYDDFVKLNTQIIGLSIDSIYSHIAWVRNIEENFGIKIQFPVLADLKQDVAKAYGMVHPKATDTSTVRAVSRWPSSGPGYHSKGAGRCPDRCPDTRYGYSPQRW